MVIAIAGVLVWRIIVANRLLKENDKNLAQRYDAIGPFMTSMLNGTYKEFTTPEETVIHWRGIEFNIKNLVNEVIQGKQDTWTICLDSFNEDDSVHLTNECKHLFHSQCLEEWYRNTYSKKEFQWPYWRAANDLNFQPWELEKPQQKETIQEDIVLQFKSTGSSSNWNSQYEDSVDTSNHISHFHNGLNLVMEVRENDLNYLD